MPTSFQRETGLQGQDESVEPLGNTDPLLPQPLGLIFIQKPNLGRNKQKSPHFSGRPFGETHELLALRR